MSQRKRHADHPHGSIPASVGTDAAFAPGVPTRTRRRTLRNMSEVRHFFRTNDVPI